MGWRSSNCKKCLLDVQISHLVLMASNRSSICDIWSHKTINSDREIVNSTRAVYFPFQTSTSFHLQFCSPVQKRPNWEKSLQRFAIRARCGRFLRDGNENIKLTATAQNSLIKKGMGLQISQYLSGKYREHYM